MRKPHRRWADLAALIVLCVAGLGVPAQASAPDPDLDEGGFGVQLMEAPAERRKDPRARRSIVDHLPPGTVIRRRVQLANHTDRRLRIEVYPAAASIGKERFQPAEGRATNELTSWISVERDHVDLNPGQKAPIKVTVQVPPTASAGERYGMVWASVTAKATSSANVGRTHRAGIRLYLNIGPGGEPASDFAIGDLVPARDTQGVPSVAIKVRNTGERALDMGGQVRLSEGPAGMRAGPFEVLKGTTLAPGETGTVTARFPREVPNGPWRIDVDLQSGMVKHSATGQVTFPDPGQVGEASTLYDRLTTPWGLIATSLVVGLLIAAGLVIAARRSRRRTKVGVG
ncbi:COG1470 family protein [Plantactinospora soyae]|uniref:Peptidase n=1 Tax=Plantactinospora soyae TaxID=1544732 RepID=A0A927M444_9ACTN|nr:peptidase [Plantactinospora soyae]MBE1486567.1 hypothetical protein [Plantactinospora soyae]